MQCLADHSLVVVYAMLGDHSLVVVYAMFGRPFVGGGLSTSSWHWVMHGLADHSLEVIFSPFVDYSLRLFIFDHSMRGAYFVDQVLRVVYRGSYRHFVINSLFIFWSINGSAWFC